MFIPDLIIMLTASVLLFGVMTIIILGGMLAGLKRQAIDRNFAWYNPQTGEWEWKEHK